MGRWEFLKKKNHYAHIWKLVHISMKAENFFFFQKEKDIKLDFTSFGRETSRQRQRNPHMHNGEKENIRIQYETGGNYIKK